MTPAEIDIILAKLNGEKDRLVALLANVKTTYADLKLQCDNMYKTIQRLEYKINKVVDIINDIETFKE